MLPVEQKNSENWVSEYFTEKNKMSLILEIYSTLTFLDPACRESRMELWKTNIAEKNINDTFGALNLMVWWYDVLYRSIIKFFMRFPVIKKQGHKQSDKKAETMNIWIFY